MQTNQNILGLRLGRNKKLNSPYLKMLGATSLAHKIPRLCSYFNHSHNLPPLPGSLLTVTGTTKQTKDCGFSDPQVKTFGLYLFTPQTRGKALSVQPAVGAVIWLPSQLAPDARSSV